MRLSHLSRMPPWPGKIFPKSLTPATQDADFLFFFVVQNFVVHSVNSFNRFSSIIEYPVEKSKMYQAKIQILKQNSSQVKDSG